MAPLPAWVLREIETVQALTKTILSESRDIENDETISRDTRDKSANIRGTAFAMDIILRNLRSRSDDILTKNGNEKEADAAEG